MRREFWRTGAALLRRTALAFALVLGAGGAALAQNACPAGQTTNNNISSAQDALNNKTNSAGYIGPTQECASLVQSLAGGDIGKTATWDKGASAVNGNLAYGTPIATFSYDSSGNYVGQMNGTKYTPPGTGGVSGNSHTAIFLNKNADGSIQVLEQWSGGPARIDTLPPGNCERCADSYSAVAGAQPVFSGSGTGTGTDTSGAGGGTGTGTTDGSGSSSNGSSNQANCQPQQQDPTKSNADQQTGMIDPDEVAKKILEILGGNCWSCKIYAAIASKAGDFISQSYKQLTNNGSESGTFAVFAATLFAIVLVWKVLVLMGASATSGGALANEMAWNDIMRFMVRAAVATSLLFGSAAMTDWMTPTNMGSSDGHVNVVHDVLIDGPILVGTSVGCKLMTQGLQAVQAPNVISCQDTGSTWMDQHTADATTILKGFHDIGVACVAIGGYMIADAGRFLQTAYGGTWSQMIGTALRGGYNVGNILKIFVIGVSGVLLIFAFLSFTFSFGLRYIDALLRAYIAMGLAPIFIILWVFDRTRPMAIAAFKAILFLGMVFIVSGIAFVFAVVIMQKGVQSAGFGGDLSPQGLLQAGKTILGNGTDGGGLGSAIGVQMGGATASDIKWDVYFILLATGQLALGMTTVAFSIAEKFMSWAPHAERMGMVNAAQSAGQTIDESFEGARAQAMQSARGVGRGAFNVMRG